MNKLVPAGLALALWTAAPVLAGPADYIYTPLVEEGERELDLKLGSAKAEGSPRVTQLNAGLGWGATAFWFTELYAKFKGEDLGNLTYDAVELENKFQLAATGRFPVELGFLLEIERPRDSAEGWEFKTGPLLQADRGLWQFNANLLAERSFGGDAPSETELAWQLQGLYRWRPAFATGLQYFGEPGELDHFESADRQSHRVGPAFFGKASLGGRRLIKYNAAWLFGVTEASPDHNFRLQTELEF